MKPWRVFHLRKRRMRLGLLAKTVAYSIGVTPKSLCEWELGRCRPTTENLRKWQRFLRGAA